ncbi:NAC domain-containing protein 87 [Brachypodium distachyon]|uniref:NAC domain-containing protein n=1 Tax=Brachypodium distachyon TaxID=15368 RepID=A0A0Q3RQ42_BRADI|nr:NAC domain-containing protein 87 [Brachypodium distachyon]KQK15122.1 hypothetical protein BRADI_1g20805v3 [Brachypodium distachyon]|eukprot:XP_003559932.1 NAC domain-containing protein 87 [Brachypodium distachyon]
MGDLLHQQQLVLAPGFRFRPTDEEIVSFYLNKKVKDNSFCTTAIGEVDINKWEPWVLPLKAKMSGPGVQEWYFYYQKDRKYPTGRRINRTTEAGYWKVTGKDKEIFHGHGLLIGMKKTLVFYMGRAPNGKKTNWVMHEYMIPSYTTNDAINTSSNLKDEWVVCRVFHKNTKEVVMSCPMEQMNNDEITISMPMSMAGDDQQGFDTSIMACTQTIQLPPPMDPTSSMYKMYDNAGSSSLVPLATNDLYFGNNQASPMSFYQHHMQMPTQMDAMAGEGFMVAPTSGPSSMVLQDHNTNTADETFLVDQMGRDGMGNNF